MYTFIHSCLQSRSNDFKQQSNCYNWKKNYFQFHFVEYFVIEARNYGIFNFKILEFSIGAK